MTAAETRPCTVCGLETSPRRLAADGRGPFCPDCYAETFPAAAALGADGPSSAWTTLNTGSRVKASGQGRTRRWGNVHGTVTKVAAGRVFVRWYATTFEDEMDPAEVVAVDSEEPEPQDAPLNRGFISEQTGFDQGEPFGSPDDVRAYFTVANMLAMFGPMVDEEAISQADLDQMAAAVISNGWHGRLESLPTIARLIRWPESTVRAFAAAGRIPGARKAGPRSWLIPATWEPGPPPKRGPVPKS